MTIADGTQPTRRAVGDLDEADVAFAGEGIVEAEVADGAGRLGRSMDSAGQKHRVDLQPLASPPGVFDRLLDLEIMNRKESEADDVGTEFFDRRRELFETAFDVAPQDDQVADHVADADAMAGPAELRRQQQQRVGPVPPLVLQLVRFDSLVVVIPGLDEHDFGHMAPRGHV